MGKARKVLVWIAGVLVAAVLVVAVAAAAGTSRFRARYEAEKAELLRRGSSVAGGPAAALEDLPAPVRRYLEVTRGAERPRLAVAVLKQRGAIRTAPTAAWMPFESEQAYSMDPPGFVWLARARVAPLVHMMARDRFVDARGNMFIRLLGALTVADVSGAEIDQGAGLRYWGEVLAFPEMVLDPHLRWEPIDDRRARVRVEHGDLQLSAEVEFDRAGLPVATHAERYRDVGGKGVLTRWSGRMFAWKPIDGRPFPSRWESIWHLPEGDFLAVKMEVEGIATR